MKLLSGFFFAAAGFMVAIQVCAGNKYSLMWNLPFAAFDLSQGIAALLSIKRPQ